MTAAFDDRPKRAVKQAGPSSKSGIDVYRPFHHEGSAQAVKEFSAASTLISGIMAISISQILGAPLKLIDPKTYRAYTAWTKENFAILMTTITEWWAPTVVRVSGDASMKGQLFQMGDGSLKCNFPHRLILMANHQLYTDWLYMWWIAYTNEMHGHIYIILKESLKQVPVIGWGMQFFNFIFLSRKWENDRFTFKQHLGRLKNKDPAWLMIFPEGTNLSQVTRDKSARWSQKTGIPDMKHQLLPRTTGLQFCLDQLRSSTNWLYDATIAYEGIPKGGYGQDVFTLKSSFLEGRPPKSVNIHWRRFKIADIPYHRPEAFERWVINRWREKDYMLECFDKFGSFPAGDALQALIIAKGNTNLRPAKSIVTEVKGGGWNEFLGIFEPIATATSAVSAIDLATSVTFEQLVQQLPLPDILKTLDHESTSPGQEKPYSTRRDSKMVVSVKMPAKLTTSNKLPCETTHRQGKVLDQLEHDERQTATRSNTISSSVQPTAISKNQQKMQTKRHIV